MISMTPENMEITRRAGLTLLGLRSRHRKKAERMAVGDRILYYVLEERVLPATATVTSAYFEDRHPVWVNREPRDDPFPYRVHTKPTITLDPWEALEAAALAPRRLYVKRWPPEQWYLAFKGDVHLLSSQDFLLVEREMQRVVDQRGRRRERPPRRPGVGGDVLPANRWRGAPRGRTPSHT
jgi:hypothetical protein